MFMHVLSTLVSPVHRWTKHKLIFNNIFQDLNKSWRQKSQEIIEINNEIISILSDYIHIIPFGHLLPWNGRWPHGPSWARPTKAGDRRRGSPAARRPPATGRNLAEEMRSLPSLIHDSMMCIYIWYNYNYNVLEYCSFSYVCHDSTLYYVKRAWRDAIWYVQRHIMVVGRNTHLLGCPSSRAGAGNMLWDWSRECGSKSFAYCTNAEFLREWQLFNKSNRWRLAVWCSYVFIRS